MNLLRHLREMINTFLYEVSDILKGASQENRRHLDAVLKKMDRGEDERRR